MSNNIYMIYFDKLKMGSVYLVQVYLLLLQFFKAYILLCIIT